MHVHNVHMHAENIHVDTLTLALADVQTLPSPF